LFFPEIIRCWKISFKWLLGRWLETGSGNYRVNLKRCLVFWSKTIWPKTILPTECFTENAKLRRHSWDPHCFVKNWVDCKFLCILDKMSVDEIVFGQKTWNRWNDWSCKISQKIGADVIKPLILRRISWFPNQVNAKTKE